MSVPAAARTMAVLRVLAEAAGPLPASTIAARIGAPRSATYRLLDVMADEGFALRLPDEGRWVLGVSAFEIGSAYSARMPLQRIGRPVLAQLARRTGLTAHLGVLHGDEVLYLHKEGRTKVVVDVGVRLPATITASGHALLGALSPKQLAASVSREPLVRGGITTPSLDELRAILRTDRERGWSVEDEAITPGTASIAVAVLDATGHPVASLALTGALEQCGSRAGAQDVAELRSAAELLARRLAS